ncbi:hypothetical protein NW754_002206 [Fusarium falciforme]|uniref:Glucose-methanol-choline oxidoreductase N-terminal domain-containing protein n=1 Tax=Fusarium falciforme TaxID=195108 RepID=A0A9W8QTE1_9HYPO|nr:hypothetical protein NW754_002206 [Fusarium falciforme]KAJ4175583.1 hypothetical protein NW767_015736 [Fusarium falciforme]KAJ4175682.1 hypothetical protein NW755_014808 [Fusarium falciforme]KAJ4177540.1 hypothetical protein NW759_017423 [Fusarium solani]
MTSPRTVVDADEFSHRTFDFLIVGGGTAGLAVASRLAESDASYTVGVIEAGGIAQGEDDIDIPGLYGRSLGGRHDWHLETVPQQGLKGRTLPWPRGKVLGGTSALNYMAWNRASKDDYDAWEALGNAGWGWEALLPFFKKSETFHPPSAHVQKLQNVSHDADTFGSSGPIQVSYPTDYSPTHSLWHPTLNAVGVETNSSHVGGSNVGVWTCVNAVDPRSATRSFATGYCSAARTNLHILTNATANEIVLQQVEGQYVATGVRFSCKGQEHVVSASREVILSAGTIKSPQILELSGIGNPNVLAQAKVPVKVDSPTVGENLQDHLMLAAIFEVDPLLTNRDDLQTDEKLAAVAWEKYSRDRAGPLTILPCSLCYVPLNHFVPEHTLAELSAKADKLPAFGAEKKAILKQRLDGGAKLGQIEYIFDLGNWNPFFRGQDGKRYGTMLQILQYPFSVGSIHISTSGEDHPSIDPQYYGGAHGALDLGVMKEASRFLDRIVHTEPLAGIIRAPASPSLATLRDDERLGEWISNNTITDWHPVGTCAMGGRAGIRGGVVDDRLRVYGVRGLRVVDASVMPHSGYCVCHCGEGGAHDSRRCERGKIVGKSR